ncbi:MAG: FkbM family methyltransferase [Variibacter sp.]
MSDSTQIEPPVFGAYAPSALQQRIIAFARATPLHHGRLRNGVVRLLAHVRPGPIDWRVGGGAFRLRLDHNGTDRALLLKPDFEASEIAFLAATACDGVFVDVGANVGAYTILVSAATGGGCRVLAIEPLKILADQLRANAALSGFDKVTVLGHALSAKEGELPLRVNGANLGASAIGGKGDYMVRARPLLDTILDAGIAAVDALKIDIEGHEDRVLVPFFSAAPRSLWPRRIVIEHLHRAAWQRDCIADMLARGYAVTGKTRTNLLLSLNSRSS